MRTDRGWRRFYALGWLASAMAATVAFVQWQGYVREVEARAGEAERTREEAARRRAVEERLRIARELHDSLTHSISVIKVQAGVASHLATKRGEEVSPALHAIQEASAEASRELRDTLSALREDDRPSGGLDRLPHLVERARDAGLAVDLTVAGTPVPLPAEVDAAAFRIVQESLTNVRRHAGPVPVTVHVDHRPGGLVVQVDNDGPLLRGAPVPGLGLIGMRERVTALGGRLRAEPRATGGFGVRAELPGGAS
ncbi:hypothetical protein GCM10023169_12020 [Georgenia halophila]|uniref:histidine kinase n=1 Tax=Georgenia halophila TaxID=620889 RepID=A0ABP8L1J8_9MICO